MHVCEEGFELGFSSISWPLSRWRRRYWSGELRVMGWLRPTNPPGWICPDTIQVQEIHFPENSDETWGQGHLAVTRAYSVYTVLWIYRWGPSCACHSQLGKSKSVPYPSRPCLVNSRNKNATDAEIFCVPYESHSHGALSSVYVMMTWQNQRNTRGVQTVTQWRRWGGTCFQWIFWLPSSVKLLRR